ncbi:MAG: flippase-like domain-containing protein [Actinomycetota bacterium]|nr:flippase-like domain-containing protein [Actinomycetota bacterium]
MNRPRLPQRPWVRFALFLPLVALVVGLLWWHGPSWNLVWDAFTVVRWDWVFAAIGLNLVSVLARSLAWETVIRQALPSPRPGFPLVFSAFSVGLFANAILPGRIGELARVAVLNRRLPPRRGAWATLVGTVFAHRVFDVIPVIGLIVYVLLTARIPAWAITSLEVFVGIGVALFAFALATARLRHRATLDELGVVKRLLAMGRQGLAVMRAPLPAVVAIFFQTCGWLCQLFAVWASMRAFDINLALPAAGLVLLLMNVATVFPLWPGNVGLLQFAIALPLTSYGIAYAHGVAFGFGLQAIEASVGVGVGLVFLAREGLSFGMVRVMPDASQAEVPEDEEASEARAVLQREHVSR